jgi:phenylacetate-CoA ligase
MKPHPSSPSTWFCSLSLPLASWRSGSGFYQEYRLLRKSLGWAPHHLKALQLQRLKYILHHAGRTVPFYRDWLADLHLKPETLDPVELLQYLPVLDKRKIIAESGADSHMNERDKKECGKWMLSEAVPESERIPYSTSGSTGEPFQFYVSRHLNGAKIARYLREMILWGIEPGTPFLKVWGAGRVPTPGREEEQAFFSRYILRRKEHLAFDLTEEKGFFLLNLLKHKRLPVLEAYTSTALFLAELARDRRGVFPDLKTVVVSGETLTLQHEKLIRETFEAKVINAYGNREFGRIAFTSPEGKGLLYSQEDFYAEYLELDPPDPNGLKRLVLTCFSNEVQPFIRYDTGDLVQLTVDKVTSSLHGSGSRGVRLGRPSLAPTDTRHWERVIGRLSECVITPDGRHLSVHFFTLLFEDRQAEIRQFQILVESPDRMRILIIPGQDFSEATGNDIVVRVREHVGTDMKVWVTCVDRIPPCGDGKRPLLRNLVKPT